MKQKKYMSLFLAAALTFAGACSFDTGQDEYDQGVLAYGTGDYSGAAKNFEAALEKNKDRAEYYLYYGFALLELGRYGEAVKNFESVVLDKEFEDVQENNKKAYRGAGIAYYLAGDMEMALSCFYSALEIGLLPEYDDDIRAYMVQANTKMLLEYQERGEMGQVLSLCDKLLAEFGESMDLYRMRADIYMEQGQYEAALKEFELAVGAGDGRMGTRLGKLLALQELGRAEEAKAVVAELSGMTPANDQEALSGAVAEFSIGDYSTAEKTFVDLYKKGYREAGYYLAYICIAKEDYAGAKGYLQELIQAGRQDAELYYQLTVCCIRLEQTGEAEEYYGKLAALGDPEWKREQDKLYLVLLEKQGKWGEAYSYMEQYMLDYITPEDEEYEQARKEYAFLEQIIKE